MVQPVRVAQTDMTRAQAAELMSHQQISAMPVIDGAGSIVGIISKTDIVREDYGDARWEGAAGQVGKFMTPFVLRARAEESLASAVLRMSEAGVHHLVITHGGAPSGMLSTLDVVNWLARFARDADA